MEKLVGIGASKGIAIGKAVFAQKTDCVVEEANVQDIQAEIATFHMARADAIIQLEKLHISTLESIGPKGAEIFEIHAMMLDDLDYIEAVEQAVAEKKMSAPWAVQEISRQFAETFSSMDDPYIKERYADVLDIGNRLIRNLLGVEERLNIPGEPTILCAKDLMPSETASLDRKSVLAFVTGQGSVSSHSAILARTMGIPSVVALGSAFERIEAGDTVVVDGTAGEVYKNPDDATLMRYHGLQKEQALHGEYLQQLKGTESVTLDGIKLEINANIGSARDIPSVLENGADGIGLFRSEFLYMEDSDYPSEEKQFLIYKETLEKMNGRPVIVRTLDMGADKQADYFGLPHEENPALGYRAIRVCLGRPHIFASQLRALYRASVYGNLLIMIPMISTLEEVLRAKKIAASVRRELSEENIAYKDSVPVGIMIETPSAALISDILARHVDFFSVGTNDLTQFTMAVDRMNASIAHLYDPGHLSVIRLLKMTVENGKKAGIWTGICGESAADPNLIPLYLALGIRELSVSPREVLEVRRIIRETNLCAIHQELCERLEKGEGYALYCGQSV